MAAGITAIAIAILFALGDHTNESYIAGTLIALAATSLWFLQTKQKDKRVGILNMNEEYNQKLQNRNEIHEYYEFMRAMQEAEKKRDFRKMFYYVEKTILVLHKFVENTKRAYGSFDIVSIPVIEIACRYWAVLGERDKLQKLKKVLEEKKELGNWTQSIHVALHDADLADRIQTYLKEKPGALQNQIGKALNVSGRDTARIIGTLDKLGKVRREQVGKTYKLYLTET